MTTNNEENNCVNTCDKYKEINLITIGFLILFILIFFRKLYLINNTNPTKAQLAGV